MLNHSLLMKSRKRFARDVFESFAAKISLMVFADVSFTKWPWSLSCLFVCLFFVFQTSIFGKQDRQ